MLENLTVIIPFRNGHATIERLLDTLPVSLPVVIVDDYSDDPYKRNRKNVRVVRLAQRGYFSGAVNIGIADAWDTHVLILNQDVWFETAEWQTLLAGKRAQFALIGDGVFGHPAHPNGYVQGTFMFLRRDAIQRVGELNAKDYPLWGATCEYQIRLCRAGFEALPVRMSDYGMRHARVGDYGSSIQATLRDEPEREKLFIRTPPAISVIITSHNYGRYLCDAVNSLIGGASSLGARAPQTFQSFEIVIVDDASTDETREVGESLANSRKGIRFIHRAVKGGSAAAANTGIQNAFGKYVTILDADDMMQPTRLEKLYRAAEANPHAVIYDDVRYFGNGRLGDVLPLSSYDFEIVLYKNLMHKGILFERAAWKQVGGYPEMMNTGREDWAINIALGAKGYCGVHIEEPLYLYRREGQNRSLTNGGPEWREFFLSQLRELFPNLYAGVRPMGCCGNKGQAQSQNVMQMRGAAASNGGRGMTANELVGQAGFVLLEYTLERAGTSMYYGPVTGAAYAFGGSRTRGYVDARDVEKMLAIWEGRQQAFRVVVGNSDQSTVTSQQSTADDEKPDGGLETAEDAAVVEAAEQVEAAEPVTAKTKTTARKSSAKKAKAA